MGKHGRPVALAIGSALCAVLLGACPGADSTPSDAGTAGDGAATPDARFAIAPPAPPEPPRGTPARAALPTLTPCAPGWAEIAGAGVDDPATCEPFPGSASTRCADDELRTPGETACAPLGPACPADGWPAGLPATGVRYVRAGASAGGTGSRAAPFATISDALTAAPPTTVIAIATGSYDEVVAVPAGVTLWGACVSGTRLASTTAGAVSATVAIGGADVVIRNVTLGGSGNALGVGRGATVTLEDVATVRATARAWSVHDGGHVVAERVAIRDTRPLGIGEEGHAIYAETGAIVELSHAAIERNADNAIIAFDPSTSIVLDDSVVRDTVPRSSDGRFGRGVNVEGGVAVTLTRSVLERNAGIGLFGANEITAHLTDTLVRDTASAMTMGGRGISVQMNSTLVLTRVALVANRSYALYASSGSMLTLDDVLMRATRTDATGLLGRGIELRSGATATVRHLLVDQMRDSAFILLDSDTHASVEDLVVRGTTPDDHGTNGRGIEVSGGAHLDGTRVRAERNSDLGLGCFGSVAEALTSSVELTDVELLDQGPDAAAPGMGRGLYVLDDCAMHVTRALIRGSREIGAGVAIVPASLVLEDAIVSDTRETALGDLGRGVNVQQGAHAELRRVVLEHNRETSIEVREEATLVAEDISILDTAQSTAPGSPGRALAVEAGATAAVTRAVIERARECGVLVLEEGSALTLSDVVVRATAERAVEHDMGVAIFVDYGATGVIERALIEDARSAGIVADGLGTSISVRDAVVRNIGGRSVDGFGGSAVIAQSGATLTLERARVEQAREGAVLVFGAGSRLTGHTMDIVDSLARACASTSCSEYPAGIALGAYDDGAADLSDFRLTHAALSAVQLARGGTVDLRDGEVSGCPIGVNVQTEGFDPRRVTASVRYYDNGRNLVADTLPVPESTIPPLTGVMGSP